jgi:hypothetical protein
MLTAHSTDAYCKSVATMVESVDRAFRAVGLPDRRRRGDPWIRAGERTM